MTSSATGRDRQSAICLDLSRLVSRVGRGPWTGVDRVEAAWVAHLLDSPRTVFGLVRLRLGYVLLDRAGISALWDRLTGKSVWGPPDLASRLGPRRSDLIRAVETDLRRLARAACLRPRLGAMLRRHLPQPAVYLNVGHSNLTDRVLGSFAAHPDTRIAVLVHDMIPLTHPQFQRSGTVEVFAARMRRVSARADLVIYNSRATQAEAERLFKGWGRVPDSVVAHLGIAPPADPKAELPPGLPPDSPWFVCLGTIEPRKNHRLLLDLWQQIDGATLLILGARGWNNEDVFARLDARPRGVQEWRGLSDGQVARLMAGAQGLLFPSHAEGYGLPALEAARLGTPVVCSTLPVFHELLGDYPVYADPNDAYSWEKAVQDLAGHRTTDRIGRAIQIPTWDAHFNLVLNRL